MNVLIDTNVVLDILLKREPHYKNAALVQALSEKGYINGYISAASVTDIYYIVKKETKSKDTALGLVKKILTTIHIAAVTERIILKALNLKWDDFEDSVQYVVGKDVAVDFIITRNTTDFEKSEIEVRTPGDFVEQFILSQQ